jgi:hypothetical protein
MPHLKILAIALLALAACGLTTAGPASAAGGTTLCKSNQTPCASGNHYPSGTKFAGSSGPMTLTTTWGWKAAQQIKCNQSEIGGLITSTGSSSGNVAGEVQSLYFTECTLTTALGTVHPCMNPPFNMPWQIAIANTPKTMDGTLTISNPKLRIQCPYQGVQCDFTASSTVLDVIGGAKATLVAKQESLEGSGGFTCPESVDWDATYTITEPAPLYLAQAE